jgi:hypothetical protein
VVGAGAILCIVLWDVGNEINASEGETARIPSREIWGGSRLF